MADVAIAVTGFGSYAPAGYYRVAWIAQDSEIGLIASSETEISFTANANQANTAIKDAAVAVYAELGIIIGGSDKKLLFGGVT